MDMSLWFALLTALIALPGMIVSILELYDPRDTQRVSKEGENALKNWQRRQECVILRENE